jgi:hypothetical protein
MYSWETNRILTSQFLFYKNIYYYYSVFEKRTQYTPAPLTSTPYTFIPRLEVPLEIHQKQWPRRPQE